MFARLLHYIQYHNATTWLFIVALFFGVGTAFAASDPELRQAAADALVSENRTLTQTDNSVLLSLNVDTFDPRLKINEVVEDDDNYYASYTFTTLTLEGGVWQETRKTDTLTVNKQILGGRDLGLHLADELGELVRGELTYLAEIQVHERKKGVTRKTVAVNYSGLIGRLLDPEEVEFDGYAPVVEEPEPQAASIEENDQSDETSGEEPALNERTLPKAQKEDSEERAKSEQESTQEEALQEGDATPVVEGERDTSMEKSQEQEQKAEPVSEEQSDAAAVESPEVASEQEPNKPEETPQPEEAEETTEAIQQEPAPQTSQPNPEPKEQQEQVGELDTQSPTDHAAIDQNQ